METCTRFQRFVRIWDAWCDGTLASKHGTAPVTAHALMLWVASSTARLFPISSASKYLVRSVATAPSDLPHGTFAKPLARGSPLLESKNGPARIRSLAISLGDYPLMSRHPVARSQTKSVRT